MYYVYLLKSKKLEWQYIGYTADLRKRFLQHQKGLSPATKPYRPFELIFYEAYKAKSDAKRREEYLKTNQGKRALKFMVKESKESLEKQV
ncbi:MAG: GIY-YIG nuclease family protein [Patescibacteria group bacterium]